MKIIERIKLRQLIFTIVLMLPMSSIATTLTFDDSTTANLNPYSSDGYTVQAYIYGTSTTKFTPNVNRANQFNYNKDYLTNNWGGSLSPSAKVTNDAGTLFDLNSISLGSGSSSEQVDVTLTGLDVDGAIIITQTFTSQVQLTNHILTGFTHLNSLEISGTTRFSFDDIDVTKPSPTTILTFDNATTANLNPYTSSGYTVQAYIYGTSTTKFTPNVNRANQFNYNKDYLTNNWGGSLSPSAKVTNDSEILFDVNSISLGSGSKYETVDVTLTGFDADGEMIITQTFATQVQLTAHTLTNFTRLHSLVISGTTRFSFDDVELTLNTEDPEPKQASFIFRKVLDTADLDDCAPTITHGFTGYGNFVDKNNMMFHQFCKRADGAVERSIYLTNNGETHKLFFYTSTKDPLTGTWVYDSSPILNSTEIITYLEPLDFSDSDGTILLQGAAISEGGRYDEGFFEANGNELKFILRSSDYQDEHPYLDHLNPFFNDRNGDEIIFTQSLFYESIETETEHISRHLNALFSYKNNILKEVFRYGLDIVQNKNNIGERTIQKSDAGEFYTIGRALLDDSGNIYFSARVERDPIAGAYRHGLYRYADGNIETIISPSANLSGMANDESVYRLVLKDITANMITFSVDICRELNTSCLHERESLYIFDGTTVHSISNNSAVLDDSGEYIDIGTPTNIEGKFFSEVIIDTSISLMVTNLDGHNRGISIPKPNSSVSGFKYLDSELGAGVIGYQGGYRNVQGEWQIYTGMMLIDTDSDGIADIDDNCSITANGDQLDTDLDGYGDACQDSDGDTVLDFNLITTYYDNCPLVTNILQLDDDNDTVGSACDNCPMTTNLAQLDTDADGIGDVCDPDLDNDLVFNDIDNCPSISNSTQQNFDGDSLGDVCDDDIDADGIANSIDGTLDGTGIFIDQSSVTSNHFTDQHLGGTSFGNVVAGALHYFISDIVGTEGVLAIGISGSSSDKKSLNICGWKINEGGLLNLLIGSEVNITCGSVIMRTEGTPAELVVGDNVTVIVMPGAGMKAKDTADGQFTVETLPESAVPVLIALGSDTLVTIPPLATAQVTEEEPGQFSVVNDEASEAPIIALVGGQEVVYQPGDTGVAVEIDIKPGEIPNAINLGSNGNIPVAIMSTATFDAQTVDPMTVTLAGAGVKLKGKSEKPMASFKDINGDGLIDLLTHVDTTALELPEGVVSAVLEAMTLDGKAIRGSDSIVIVK